MTHLLRKLWPAAAAERRQRFATAQRSMAVLTVASYLIHLLHSLAGVSAGLPDWLYVDVIHNVTEVGAGAYILLEAGRRESPQRRALLWLGLGATLWGVGNSYWSLEARLAGSVPAVSAADLCFLSFYPGVLLGVTALLRRPLRGVRPSLLLDSAVGVLTVAAVGVIVVLQPVAHVSHGPLFHQAVQLAYPFGDVVLLAVTAGALTLLGWHVDRGWKLLTLGLALFCFGDADYIRANALGSYHPGSVLDQSWATGLLLLALAARAISEPADRQRPDSWGAMSIPLGAAGVSVGLLVYGNYTRLGPVPVALAAAAVIGVASRTLLTIRELRRLAHSEREARTDALTGLPNRRAFYESLASAVEGEQPRRAFAVLMLDMDGFKEINDTLGHAAGDEVLREAGRRLLEGLRQADLVCRLGGDEFAAVLSGVADRESAARVAERVEAVMREPVAISGIEVALRLSLGVALYPQHGHDAATLFQHADVAMYQAKAAGSRFEVYNEGSDPHCPERLSLVAQLRRACDQGELVLHYQPKICAVSGELHGLEALVRWQHPTRGLLMPDAFIDAAERGGLMTLLTERVLGMALDHLEAWRTQGLTTQVAVNVGTGALMDTGLPAALAGELERRGLDAACLRLEATETAVLADPVRTGQVLAGLWDLGIGLSLDDFGTGHSSLAQLKRLMVDEIKIDRSFVQNMLRDPSDAAIVRSVIELARNMGLRTVAEGVESAELREELAALGCQQLQGYWISRPLAAEALPVWLRSAGVETRPWLARDARVRAALAGVRT